MQRTTFKTRETMFGEIYYGTQDLETLIPKSVPLKFLSKNNRWSKIAEDWFRLGLGKDSKLIPIYGVEKEKAIKHIQCLFNTWFLTKDQKISNAAFLMSQWFIDIKL